MSESRMEKHEAVEVGVVGVEMSRLVHGMVVLDIRADLHLMTYPVFDDGTERVNRCALRQWKLRVPVRHAFWADENEVEGDTWEHVRQLDPYFAR